MRPFLPGKFGTLKKRSILHPLPWRWTGREISSTGTLSSPPARSWAGARLLPWVLRPGSQPAAPDKPLIFPSFCICPHTWPVPAGSSWRGVCSWMSCRGWLEQSPAGKGCPRLGHDLGQPWGCGLSTGKTLTPSSPALEAGDPAPPQRRTSSVSGRI